MLQNSKISLIGTLIFLTFSVAAENENERKFIRPKRSFGFSNPIFARVFNPYDNRPLTEKFFGRDYVPSSQENGPHYYSLWSSQPVLEEENSAEQYLAKELPWYLTLGNKFEKPYQVHHQPHPVTFKPHPQTTKSYPEATKPHPQPSKPCPMSTNPYPPSKPHPESSKPYPSKPYPASINTYPSSKPYPEASKPCLPSKPYPEASKPYPPSKPYPEASKPNPTSKPFPETFKPYPPSKPYPASKPYSESMKPCPHPINPLKTYPESHQMFRKPAIGRLFVDEVNTNIFFNPETGKLVINAEKKNGSDYNNRNSPSFEIEQTGEEIGKNYVSTTTVNSIAEDKTTITENKFKLLPNYDIKTKFDDCILCSSTQKALTNKLEVPFKISREQLIDYKTTLRLLKLYKKFDEEEKKMFHGSDNSKWPENGLQTLIDEHKKSKKIKDCKKNTTTSSAQPNEVLKNGYLESSQDEKTTIKPCSNKTSHRFQQNEFSTEKARRLNIRQKISDITQIPFLSNEIDSQNTMVSDYKQRQHILDITGGPFLSNKIVPHDTMVSDAYSQFLSPPGYVIYRKFNEFVEKDPTTTSSPRLDQASYHSRVYQKSPSRGLEFRLFNKKFDQSVLDGLRNKETVQIDHNKLDEITHNVNIEPIRRKRPNKEKEFLTLDSPYKALNVIDKISSENYDKYDSYEITAPSAGYGVPSISFELPNFNDKPKDLLSTNQISNHQSTLEPQQAVSTATHSKFDIGDEGSKYLELDLKPPSFSNIGDIPLGQNQIWDNKNKVLIDSYGQRIRKKYIY